MVSGQHFGGGVFGGSDGVVLVHVVGEDEVHGFLRFGGEFHALDRLAGLR